MLPFTSKAIWPWENKNLNLVKIDSPPIIICLVSMWPGHRVLLSEEGITNHVSTLEQRSIGRAAVNLVYYSLCNFRIQILWWGWEMNEWELQSKRYRLPTQRERVAWKEKEGGGGGSHHGDDDNPGHAQMVFCSPQRTGYWETYTNTSRTLWFNLRRMPGWLQTNM